jgi:cytochrome b561
MSFFEGPTVMNQVFNTRSHAVSPDPSQDRPPQNPGERYGAVAIAFHWATFALVVVVGILGLLHDSWPRHTQAFWINIHALLGLFLWLLVLARLVWRARHAPPAPPKSLTVSMQRLSTLVHLLLYGLLLITPIIGIVTFVYHGRIFDFGIFQIDPGIKKDRAIFHPTEEFHGYLAYVIFGLAALHALAALWHRFRVHDGVLGRMWPGSDAQVP